MDKGNIVTTERGQTGIVLAVRKDGTRAMCYLYGPDREDWLPVEWLTVETAGKEQCYKCAGSGLYYFGGMVLNGVYTGKTGPCFGCGGDGQQDDADRIRCHYYWHRKVEAGDDIESPLEPSPEPESDVPERAEAPKPKVKIRSKRRNKGADTPTDHSARIDAMLDVIPKPDPNS